MAHLSATQAIPEQSSVEFVLRLVDSTGALITPDTVVWSLMDRDGTIINSREEVALVDLDTENTILLTGDDTAIVESFPGNPPDLVGRRLLVEATYTSATHGSGMLAKRIIEFNIINLYLSESS